MKQYIECLQRSVIHEEMPSIPYLNIFEELAEIFLAAKETPSNDERLNPMPRFSINKLSVNWRHFPTVFELSITKFFAAAEDPCMSVKKMI